MRKVLIILVLFILNLLIIGPSAQSQTTEQQYSPFFCQNKSWVKRALDRVLKTRDYLMVLSTSDDYKLLHAEKSLLEQKLSKVKILESFDFKLAILKKDNSYLLVENSCFTKSDALSNMKTLRFFFNIKGSVIQSHTVQSIGRLPASVSTNPLYFVNNE